MEIVNSAYSEATIHYLLEHLFDTAPSLNFAVMRTDLVTGINQLPLDERVVVVLNAMGFSAKETSRRTGMHYKRVERLLVRGRLRLLVVMNLRGSNGRERVSTPGVADGSGA